MHAQLTMNAQIVIPIFLEAELDCESAWSNNVSVQRTDFGAV